MGHLVTLFSTKPSYALSFDGVDDYVNVENSLGITGYPFTFEAKAKLDTLSTAQVIMAFNLGSTQTFAIQYINTSGKFAIRARNTTNFNSVGTTTPLANVDYHVAGVFESATVRKLYVNGVLEVTGVDSVLAFTPARLVIGQLRVPSPAEFLDGIIRETRVWSTARTEAEILANMNRELIGSETGLVGYWKMNEGAGIITRDSTANGNNGTITGARWVAL